MSTAALRSILPATTSPPRRLDVVRTEIDGETVSFRLPGVVDTPEELIIESPSTTAHLQARATQATLTAAAEELEGKDFGDVSRNDSDDTTRGSQTPPTDPETITLERIRTAKAKDNKTLWALGLATVGFIATSLVVHL